MSPSDRVRHSLVCRVVVSSLFSLCACGGQKPAQVAPPVAVAPPAPTLPARPAPPSAGPPADALFLDSTRPVDERVADLVKRMTLEEKVMQMMDVAPEIKRLGVPAYNWWNEALHGVARAGIATVFPQAIALGATWDDALMFKVATATSDEARAKFHEFQRHGKRGRYEGLTFFSPNINIFRDPRWGRGHETYGEDPFLTARMGVAFIKGMQGDDPRYLKTIATAKHYAVHSGPEVDRHGFDARVSRRELFDTYLPHFEAAIREGKAESVMSAYNAVDGKPASASPMLLEDILRKQWGFQGYVVTDCGAVSDIYKHHKVVGTAEAASAAAVKAGTDVECGNTFKKLVEAVKQGLASESDIDIAVRRLFRARFRLGMFDPDDKVPYAKIPYSVNDSPAHRELARQAAREAVVLLENRNGALPLPAGVKKIAVLGPTADSQDVLLGNYNGTPSQSTTILAGIRVAAKDQGAEVSYAQGSDIVGDSTAKLADAVATAKWADTVILVMGLSPREEGEEHESKTNPGGDRTRIDLPPTQQKLIEAVVATHKPVVLVVTGGSSLAFPFARKNIPAILMTWYSGQEGGAAVADVLFGKYNPAGRLPLTFYASVDQLPPFKDYGMKGRTYRYFPGEPEYHLGHGKSYTTFKYSAVKVERTGGEAGETFALAVDLQNTGKRDGDEVVQLYVTDESASVPVPVPVRALAAFRRVSLKAGEKQIVTFRLTPRELSIVDEEGRRKVEPGWFTVAVGGGQPGKGNKYKSPAEGVTTRLEVTGKAVMLP